MEGFEDQDELEDEAQEEVDKVLWELTAGQKKCSSNFCLLSKILDQNMFPKYIRKFICVMYSDIFLLCKIRLNFLLNAWEPT